MPTAANQYRLQEEVVRLFEGANLDLHGLRLAHALHALTARALGPLGLPSLTLEDTKTPAVLTAEIVRFMWPASTNDLQSVRAGLASLAATDLFAELEFDKLRHRIEARFANHVANAAVRLTNRRFAILDADRVRDCNSVSEILWYTRAAMHGGSRQPMFRLPKIGGEEPWSPNAHKRWVRAAQVFSFRLGQSYVIQPTRCATSGDRTGVVVKITHGRSEWTSGCLYERNPRHMPTVVVLGSAQRLDRKELAARKHWRFADRPY